MFATISTMITRLVLFFLLCLTTVSGALLLISCGGGASFDDQIETQLVQATPTSLSQSTGTQSNSPGSPVLQEPAVNPEGEAAFNTGKDPLSQIMDSLLESTPAETNTLLKQVILERDKRFIPVLIELIRAADIGLVDPQLRWSYIEVLEDLSEQRFADNWFAWVEWYGNTGIQPPDGFTGWKGKLLARIDPRFADFLQDDFTSNLRVEEIMWGGVVVDGIPALDNPDMIPGDQAEYLLPGEAVFGISINGDSRAYPLRIMDWHEMANDVVGEVPVSLAYCTLCGAGIAYDGRVEVEMLQKGDSLTFGSSGFLYRSNKLMYDRQTRTLWNQLTGEPVLGILAGKDIRLSLLPVVLTTWEEWLEQHPGTLVLDINTGYERPYEVGAAYGGYFASDATMFPVWQRSDLLNAKDRIYAIQIGGIPKAYPIQDLVEAGILNDTIGDVPIVLVADSGTVTSKGRSIRPGISGSEVQYDSGAEVRAYLRDQETFSSGGVSTTVFDSRSNPWRVTEEALLGPNGERLERIPGHLAYWFGWFAFFPDTLVYGLP